MTAPLSKRAAAQIDHCRNRIADPREAERFAAMLVRAAELAQQSKALRLAAWQRYRTLTGLKVGERA